MDGNAVSLEVRTSTDPDAVRLLAEALRTARAEGAYVEGAASAAKGVAHLPFPAPSAGDVEVRVLGPVEIFGTGKGEVAPSRRAAALAVVVYLACHRRPVPVEEISGALWPLEAGSGKFTGPQRKTVMNVISRARALIGYGSDGQDRILYSSEGYYLSPEVTCDLDRFRALAGSGELSGLRDALAMVQGEPFSGAASSQFFEWVLAEHLDLGVVAEVLDVAESLGRRALESEDYALAIDAARKGLALDPVREQLCCIWMEAAGRRGDLAEVDRVYQRLGQVLRQRLHPLQEPQEQSRRVWATYCRRDMAAFGAGTSPWDI